MAVCTTYGYPGTNVPLYDLLTTGSSLNCFISGYTQTANTMTISVFQTGNSTALASISGGGNGGAITAMTTDTFSISSGNTYYATVTSTQGQTPRVLYNYDSLAYGTTTYAGTVSLCSEDTPNGGDCDFNDSVVTISWTLYAG